MLSRIADSLFWMTRYLERAEDTARLLNVNYLHAARGSQQALSPAVGLARQHRRRPRRVLRPLPRGRPATGARVPRLQREHPDSVVGCVAKARENARTIRDRISREMWEDLNGFYLEVNRGSGRRRHRRAASLLRAGQVREPSLHGRQPRTLPRDEGWHFLNAGQALERAEMTARIVDVQYHTLVAGPATTAGDSDTHQWMAVLKSVAAYEFYRRTYNTRVEPERVAELLLLNPQHPRSLRFSIGVLQSALRAISGSGVDTWGNEAERLTGRLFDSLKYDRIEDILGRGLHPFLAEAQETCRAIGEELARTYFYYEVRA